ncbi:MAG: hypothetical protein E6H81_05040 [Chloroflexi bacterium]|nr:MAG: hypothetical protein E6H81_05040 [Chloroflexota bacterium]
MRSADAELADAFFVSAVATLLLIRIGLEATGYPRLAGGGLHIAHVLWGGLGMLVALGLLLLFLSPFTRLLAAIVGGAGFGAFIDELGKFVTADNDYFFQPTAALVYVFFAVMFLAVRQIRRFRRLSPRESLVNAIELAESLVAGELSETDRTRALELLADADASDPLVSALRERFRAAARLSRPSVVQRIGATAGDRYSRVAGSRWFRRAIAGLFILQGAAFVVSLAYALVVIGGTLIGVEEARAELEQANGGNGVTSWIQILSGFIAGVFIVRGLLALRRSRLHAYRAFELAVLVDLLLAQPFAFLTTGFGAAADVFIDLALLAALRFMQTQERWMGDAAESRSGVILAAQGATNLGGDR